MFDLTTFGNSLLVTGSDINLNETGKDALVSVYTRVGGYSGFETNAAAWVLQGQETVTSMGEGNATSFDFSNFLLDANTVYGVYFSVTDYANSRVEMRYTNGTNSYSNADLQLDLGIARGANDFSGGIFDSRTWNGTLYYTAQTSVPEPSILAIFALGLIGLTARKYKK